MYGLFMKRKPTNCKVFFVKELCGNSLRDNENAVIVKYAHCLETAMDDAERLNAVRIKGRINFVEIDREVYGNDRRAINRHSVRNYIDANGNRWRLDRTLDTLPRFFTMQYLGNALGKNGTSMDVTHRGSTEFGEGYTWKRAEDMVFSNKLSGEERKCAKRMKNSIVNYDEVMS